MNESTEINFQGKSYPCCTSLTMDIIGGKWKSVIIFHLREGKMRYNQLRKAMPTVTERTLGLQLKKLELDKVVKREVQHKKPPLKVYYSLTDTGLTLVPIIISIAEWGEKVGEKMD